MLVSTEKKVLLDANLNVNPLDCVQPTPSFGFIVER